MNYVTLAGLAIALGYGAFQIILAILPSRLKADHGRQYTDIVDDAKSQAITRKKTEAERIEDECQLIQEQLESNIKERMEDLKLTEEDLNGRERTIQLEDSRVQKITKDIDALQEKVSLIKGVYETKAQEIASTKTQLDTALEAKASANSLHLKKALYENIIEARQIEHQKALRFLDDELSTSQKRLAQRTMARVMARYTPEFYWPKSVNYVELADRTSAERLAAEGQALIADLKEKAGIEIELIADPSIEIPTVKLAGGAGINREAVRLALTEMIPKGPTSWAKAASTYDKHRISLEQEAIHLGRIALKEIKLAGIHPEIQKLIGYLNWRTSYRQNQWYHTVEVAKLAGILAYELGEDPDAAKRCGLLHDIGKALDYQIEGSHAVISGDYADRFGEKRLICDTVMSHHNDLIVESPLAYILRAADTLSGARPGARVNLEEGYQMRLSGIDSAVRSFPGVINVSIMNGAREVHVEVNHKRVQEKDLEALSKSIAQKIEEDVAYPGEIKILVTRRFEATAVA